MMQCLNQYPSTKGVSVFLTSVGCLFCVLGSWTCLLLLLLGLLSYCMMYWWHRLLQNIFGRTSAVPLMLIYMPVWIYLWFVVVFLIPVDQVLELGHMFISWFTNE